MITEIAIIDVAPGHESDFAAAFRAKGYELLTATPGCISARMHQSSETPTRFIGVNQWESRQAHLDEFRGTERYEKYREALGPYLAAAPRVEHFEDVMDC